MVATASRRNEVLDAAVAEFARHGYRGASTVAIARRAGISQPYVHALFGSKQALFLAAHDRVVDAIALEFARHAAETEGLPPAERLRALGATFVHLRSRDDLLCQLQGYAAAGDPEVREHVRRRFVELFDAVAEMTGATRDEVALFVAGGMFFTVAGALDVPPDYWPNPPYGGPS